MTKIRVRQVASKLVHNNRFRKILVILMSLMAVLGVLIVPIEQGVVGAKILNYGDGLWFAITTVTGVGYGDLYPVSSLGRVVASILEVGGVVLFGSLVALVSVELMRYQDDFQMKRLHDRLDLIEQKLDEVKRQTNFLVKK